MTHFRYASVRLVSVLGSELTIGFGANTFAIRLKNGPNGAVRSSKTILKKLNLLKK